MRSKAIHAEGGSGGGCEGGVCAKERACTHPFTVVAEDLLGFPFSQCRAQVCLVSPPGPPEEAFPSPMGAGCCHRGPARAGMAPCEEVVWIRLLPAGSVNYLLLVHNERSTDNESRHWNIDSHLVEQFYDS